MREFKFFVGYVYMGEIRLPMMTRVVPTTIAQDLVPVQPMRQPSGLLFYYEYNHNAGEITQIIRNARI